MSKRIFNILLLVFICVFSYACNKNEDIKSLENNEHNTHWITTLEPTCTTLGSKNLVCKDCGEVLTTAKIELLDHTEVIKEKINPTCVDVGLTEGSYCSMCGQDIIKQEIISPLGHSYILDFENSDENTLLYVCKQCNDSYKVENEHNTCESHIESDWIVVNDSTCKDLGKKHKVCNVCNIELEVESISLKEHSKIVVNGIPATCTSNGLTDGEKCSICNDILIEQLEIPMLKHSYVITDSKAPTTLEKGYIIYSCTLCKDTYTEEIDDLNSYNPNEATVIILSDNGITLTNDNGGVIVNDNIITITLGGEYDLSGTLSDGGLIIKLSEEDEVILNLRGANLSSSFTDPIFIESGNKIEISAKSETVNYIYDKRTISDDAVGAAIYSKVDLEIKGKGELNIESTYNNGIGSTKDLEIKNVTLNVNVPNNALKGNDSLTIESGKITAISSSGDALKTENSDISDKGNQRGTITINGGVLELYAACDGIDAAYDLIINGGDIKVYTESYSEYSGDVTVTTPDTLYIRVSSKLVLQNKNYKYSAKFIYEDGTSIWVNASSLQGQSNNFQLSKPDGAKYIKIYCYSAQQEQGQDSSYTYATDQMAIPSNFDQYYITKVLSYSQLLMGEWSNYSTQQMGPGGPGGRPGMQGPNDGNKNKADYSCKGLKADNSIIINNGIIYVKSHDDAIHTNSDVLLENGNYGKADLTINGGKITLYSDDDALHSDGTLTVAYGNVIIENSYEGVEGNNIYFNGGTVQIISLDDGINAKSSLYFTGGIVYLSSGGDGIDSNNAIIMTGGVVLATGPSNGGNGVIDYDRSFTISGGLLLAIGCNGMNQKPTAQNGATSTSKTISTTTNSYVTVTSNSEVVAVLKVIKNSQNYCVLAYGNSEYPNATVNITTSNSYELVNDLYYVK